LLTGAAEFAPTVADVAEAARSIVVQAVVTPAALATAELKTVGTKKFYPTVADSKNFVSTIVAVTASASN
jgi:hypothetical protein